MAIRRGLARLHFSSSSQDLPEAEFEEMMRRNYYSAVYAIRAVVKGMKERRKGRIVLISSQAGQIGLFG